jgi:hypothetical protein
VVLGPIHDFEQFCRGNRLRDVFTEGVSSTRCTEWVSTHRDEVALSELRIGLECSDYVVPIDAGEDDVTQDDVRKETARDFESCEALTSDFDTMAGHTQARSHALRGVRVIVDHENAAGMWCGLLAR